MAVDCPPPWGFGSERNGRSALCGSLVGMPLVQHPQLPRGSVDDQAVDQNVLWHQGMAAQQGDGVQHGGLLIAEPGEPGVQVDGGVPVQGFQRFGGDAPGHEVMADTVRMHPAYAAVGMADPKWR